MTAVQGDICAAVNVDNHRIGQTDWKSPGNHAWDQVFKVDLEKNRELEVDVYWKEGNTLCGLLYLKLEDFFDVNTCTLCLPLEPQGILLTEISYEGPKTEKRKQVNLKRAKQIFKRRNFPRPWQFSTDVVTWTRLVFKHPQYTQQEEGRSKKSPPQSPGLILNPLDLRGTSNGAVEDDIHINNQQGKEPNNSQRQNGIPPPPHEGMSDLSIPPDHEVILPPPKGFEDEESLKSTRNEGESLIEEITPLLPRMFSPTATHQHTSRAVSEPPPTIPCLLYTSPSPRDRQKSRMPSSA